MSAVWAALRNLPLWLKVGGGALIAIILIGVFVGGDEAGSHSGNGGSTAAASPSPTPTPTATTQPTPSPSPTATATPALTLRQWYDKYAQNVAIVIATANGLVTYIDQANETRIQISCGTLDNNYKTYLSQVPAPPDESPDKDLAYTYDLGRGHILSVRSKCTGGIISKPNLATARSEAMKGSTLLNSVLDVAEKG